MAGTLAIRVDYPAAVADAWRQAPEVLERHLVAAVYEAELLLQRETVERTPIGVGGGGGLRGSIQAGQPRRAGDAIIGEVGTSLPYAPAVEFGAKPHMPPLAPLALWAEHKLGLSEGEAERAAWGIARAIRRRGTEGRFMFTKALDANEAQLRRIFELALGRAVAELGGIA
ncbi:hypothetical protein [Azospirillum sp. A39]|uniref:hypothetical protein n=1 Tax=Azospirillum sp. A39 TaxID=3462279 RepID=UPI0040458DFB